jgi:hypothetical protein
MYGEPPGKKTVAAVGGAAPLPAVAVKLKSRTSLRIAMARLIMRR